ncbi:hypothetical protein OS493_027117 [Desmophyllum pertusum]|uniref:Uncharacterized protein n=1 Tax=Desmophyllum pertusum TaxID=174260 RepID=A0A9X0D7C0_9CNID|nr:hypothetical protein OS493_027117 [Desmophyllum pertusum]
MNTSAHSASYSFNVAKGFWTYLGFSWYNTEKLLTIQQNGGTSPTTIKWNVCHACARSQTSNTSVMLGAGSFPNASFDEIAIWRKPLQKEKFVDIYNTYKGPCKTKRSIVSSVYGYFVE